MLKLALTLGLVVAAIMLLPRLQARAIRARDRAADAARKATQRASEKAGVDDLVQCPTCGAYGTAAADGRPAICDCRPAGNA